MSRAFVTDKEDWIYCAKAGERCMHAESGKPCRKTDCEHFGKKVQMAGNAAGGLRLVSKRADNASNGKNEPIRENESGAKAGRSRSTKAADSKGTLHRETKKASLPKPRRWGGRSGS